jgi:hypothetical protein
MTIFFVFIMWCVIVGAGLRFGWMLLQWWQYTLKSQELRREIGRLRAQGAVVNERFYSPTYSAPSQS